MRFRGLLMERAGGESRMRGKRQLWREDVGIGINCHLWIWK
jgi:hypothetical protein